MTAQGDRMCPPSADPQVIAGVRPREPVVAAV